MALAFLTLNGVGLGHLVRATTLCRVLESAGERPVIFSQGLYPLDDRTDIPGRRVPSLWPADTATRKRIEGDLLSMIEISVPAVLVEDTHPSPVRMPARVRRVLLVRPTTFQYLRRLHEGYRRVYNAFLLCDAPGSPTWPYSPAQTEEILSWRDWHVIGPVYRTIDAADIEDVRARHHITNDERVAVFTMGGGGQHRPSDGDAREFVAFASGITDQLARLDARMRPFFITGPYFPDGIPIPDRFEVLRHEPRLPALLALAHGAIIRSGFNTIWECLASATPFWPFIGTTFDEPTVERLQQMRAQDLVAADVATFWNDPAWRSQFTERSARTVAQWPGVPDARMFQRLIMQRESIRRVRYAVDDARVSPVRSVLQRLPMIRRRALVPLIIRVDDIVSIDSTVDWLLRLLASRKLRASLEVVPYLADFGEARLHAYDPGGHLFEVSQHGYAHIPRSIERGRFEFATHETQPQPGDVRDIARGRAVLMHRFATRFSGGFSPPFDALPSWLPAVWHAAGGRFISGLAARNMKGSAVPVVQAGWDVWDWPNNRLYPMPVLRRALDRQIESDGYSGISLHPRCLRSHMERARLTSLLDHLLGLGFTSASLRETVFQHAPQMERVAMVGRDR